MATSPAVQAKAKLSRSGSARSTRKGMHCLDVYNLSSKFIEAKTGIQVHEVRGLTSKHSDVARGCEISDWLMKSGVCTNRLQTDTIGNLLMSYGIFRNVGQGENFHDDAKTVYRHVSHEKATVKDNYIKLLEKCIRNLRMNQTKKIQKVQRAVPFWKQKSFFNQVFFTHLLILLFAWLFGYGVAQAMILDFLSLALTWVYLDPPTNHNESIKDAVKWVGKKVSSIDWRGFWQKFRNNSAVSAITEKMRSKSAPAQKLKTRTRSGASERPSLPQLRARSISRPTLESTRDLRAHLEQNFPAENKVYSDNYLSYCLETWDLRKAKERLSATLAWRSSNNILRLHFQSVRQDILQSGSLYVYGYDKFARPVIWVRPARKDWANLDIEHEVLLHVLMIEHAIRFMLPGHHQFLLMTKSEVSFETFSVSFMKGILNMFTTAYCKRLGLCYVGPSNTVVNQICKMVMPLLTAENLREKINFVTKADQLLDVLTEEQVPAFWGGDASHDNIFSNKKLDFNLMLQNQARLKDQLKRLDDMSSSDSSKKII